ncbi:hypothetical protein F2Q69_00028986 [Brassica cretica]|uniref:Uncharacterized protein n=1 Tax=Brassica cretica TaxID=69181 RepID=A0A8S9S616_BRACR|nr:hypothetical protein F2Q69_00028986 [Brassica cretica]
METRFDREGRRNEAVLDSRISDGGGRRRRHDAQRLGFRFVIARERSQRETSGGFRWRDTKRSRLVLAPPNLKPSSPPPSFLRFFFTGVATTTATLVITTTGHLSFIVCDMHREARWRRANAGEKEVSCGVSNPSEIKELSIIKELHLRTVKEFKIDS